MMREGKRCLRTLARRGSCHEELLSLECKKSKWLIFGRYHQPNINFLQWNSAFIVGCRDLYLSSFLRWTLSYVTPCSSPDVIYLICSYLFIYLFTIISDSQKRKWTMTQHNIICFTITKCNDICIYL